MPEYSNYCRHATVSVYIQDPLKTGFSDLPPRHAIKYRNVRHGVCMKDIMAAELDLSNALHGGIDLSLLKEWIDEQEKAGMNTIHFTAGYSEKLGGVEDLEVSASKDE